MEKRTRRPSRSLVVLLVLVGVAMLSGALGDIEPLTELEYANCDSIQSIASADAPCFIHQLRTASRKPASYVLDPNREQPASVSKMYAIHPFQTLPKPLQSDPVRA